MGLDYALVHLYYNIPPAVLLTFIYWPLLTGIDIYKVLFLISIAVAATTPWDSYLIRNNVWSYPPDAIVGPTIFRIPYEEVFFFVIQTYNTSLLYLLLSKSTFHPVYLRGYHASQGLRFQKWLVASVIAASISVSALAVQYHGESFYMGLICLWAGPFMLMLWLLGHQLLLGLPLKDTLCPIVLPTLYLWVVDTLALSRGTWVIESGTKLNWQIWKTLDIEEAVFFVVTNVLIVFGLVAFDNAVAVLDSFPDLFRPWTGLPSPLLLVEALLLPPTQYDELRLQGYKEALDRLQRKSRSFFIASGVFPSKMRRDLILLYSFCRVADDLVDEAKDITEAKEMISRLKMYLDLSYDMSTKSSLNARSIHIREAFPASAQKTLELLPTNILSPKPLYKLLEGFVMDLGFSATGFPITDESRLQTYAALVAGTVAQSCIELVYYHSGVLELTDEDFSIIASGNQMGMALQYVNIARDVGVDAEMGRVYLPTTWLKQMGLEPGDVLKNPHREQVDSCRKILLERAMLYYKEARQAIEKLPKEARGPMRVTVESYMEIGRTLMKKNYTVKKGRATVPLWRRLVVAWRALNG